MQTKMKMNEQANNRRNAVILKSVLRREHQPRLHDPSHNPGQPAGGRDGKVGQQTPFQQHRKQYTQGQQNGTGHVHQGGTVNPSYLTAGGPAGLPGIHDEQKVGTVPDIFITESSAFHADAVQVDGLDTDMVRSPVLCADGQGAAVRKADLDAGKAG